jgi:hypothetical protein
MEQNHLIRSVSFDTSFLLKLDPAVDKCLKLLARDMVPCFVTSTVLSELEQLRVWRRIDRNLYDLAMQRWHRVGAKPIDFHNRLVASDIGKACLISMKEHHGVSSADIQNDCSIVVEALEGHVDVFLSEDFHFTSRISNEVIHEVAHAGCQEYQVMCSDYLHAMNAQMFLRAYGRRAINLDVVASLQRDVRKPGKLLGQ